MAMNTRLFGIRLGADASSFGAHRPPPFKQIRDKRLGGAGSKGDSGTYAYPHVAVQLPMFNERAVCQDVIECASNLEWPGTKLVIQVCQTKLVFQKIYNQNDL